MPTPSFSNSYHAERGFFVTPLDRSLEPSLRRAIDAKAKPLGALGRIEDLALHIGLVTRCLRPKLGKAALAVFAGDHGIVDEGVTAYPSEVSAQVAQMVLDGTAGASVAARAVSADVFVIDAGLATPLPPHPALLDRARRRRTANFAQGPAMTDEEAAVAFDTGVAVARDLAEGGYGILALGEIGIGNSSAAAVVAHAVTGIPLEALVGAGAGLPPLGLAHKLAVLRRATKRTPPADAWEALSQFGGFEIAMLAGAMTGAASARQIAIVDGYIATSAVCVAVSLNPNLRDYLVFGHLSPEAGHAALLDWLGARPLLDLGLRLGEGTGAALAIPLVRMAEGLLTEMADLPADLRA